MSKEIFFDAVASLPKKIDQAISLIWLNEKIGGAEYTSVRVLSDLFDEARLPRPNPTRLKCDLSADKRTITSKGGFKLTREAFRMIDGDYSGLFLTDPGISERFDLSRTPYLSSEDIARAREMASLYLVAYCLENSMRKLIENVLSKKLGKNWWEVAASSSMKKKHQDRIDNESKKKWAPTRSDDGPLYAVDWADLCTLMRKYEADFLPHIGEVNFLHRFDDLGTFRNLIAHNGFFKEGKHIKRIEIAWEDWVGQLMDHPSK